MPSDDMPERIWADQDNLTWVEADPTERMKSAEVEFVRSDLCASGQQVRVLEWRSTGYDRQTLEASALGLEVFYRVHGKPKDWTLTSPGAREYVHTPGYETRADAQAAAQTDYERRILAALTPAPQPEGQARAVKAITECIETVDELYDSNLAAFARMEMQTLDFFAYQQGRESGMREAQDIARRVSRERSSLHVGQAIAAEILATLTPAPDAPQPAGEAISSARLIANTGGDRGAIYTGFPPEEREPSVLLPAAKEVVPVAWTGNGSLMALADGREGFLWPTKGEAHPIPLFAAPPAPGIAEAAYLAGFMASSEDYNGEYPGIEYEHDARWCFDRDAALRALEGRDDG